MGWESVDTTFVSYFFSLRNREIKLEHLLDNFLSEGVDLDILVCMVSSDLKRTIARQQL